MSRIYVIRHAASTGQSADAPLSPEGYRQALALADALSERGIERLWSSPMRRTTETASPLAERLRLSVQLDDRLAERVLSTEPLADWRSPLRASFDDFDAVLPGGESSRQAMWRAEAVWADIAAAGVPTAVVTHGNLMALMLRSLDPRWGFDAWAALATPDVYVAERTLAGWNLTHMPIGGL